MKSYIEQLNVNDDKSARVTIFFPKLTKKNFELLHFLLTNSVVLSTSFRPTKRVLDATPKEVSKSESNQGLRQ